MYKVNGTPSTQLPEYGIWWQMRQRCNKPNNPAYHHYGGRGIAVCDRWNESFMNFHKDMGLRPSPELSLDRIDNDGDYCKDNCRWATQIQQHNNTRANRMLTHDGKTMTMSEWARHLGLKQGTLKCRLYRGWSPDRALTEPVQGTSR